MKRRKEQSNVRTIRLDPKAEKAIYNKRDVFITFVTEGFNGQAQSNQFSITYEPDEDTYVFCDDACAKARYLAVVCQFITVGGVLTVRTFLDDISHQRFLPDGRSIAVPFQEIRMFRSNGKKTEQIDVVNLFLAMITDFNTGKIDLNLIEKNEIFCDETNRFSTEEMIEKVKDIVK